MGKYRLWNLTRNWSYNVCNATKTATCTPYPTLLTVDRRRFKQRADIRFVLDLQWNGITSYISFPPVNFPRQNTLHRHYWWSHISPLPGISTPWFSSLMSSSITKIWKWKLGSDTDQSNWESRVQSFWSRKETQLHHPLRSRSGMDNWWCGIQRWSYCHLGNYREGTRMATRENWWFSSTGSIS